MQYGQFPGSGNTRQVTVSKVGKVVIIASLFWVEKGEKGAQLPIATVCLYIC